MLKKKIYITIIFIFLLAFFAGNLSYPKYLNQGIDFFNSKFSLKLPHFWDVPFKLGLDLQGGTHLVYEADFSGVEEKDYNSLIQGLRDVIERRINIFGVREPLVQTQEASGHYRLVVEMAGIKDPAQAIKMIGETPYLEFKEEEEDYQAILERNQKVAETKEGQIEDPFKSTLLTGKYLEKAEVGFDQTTYKPLILLQFNEEGSKIFEELTARNVGKPLAIYIDGVPISAPTVQETISGGKAQITGSFTTKEAQDLARNLNAGALPVPITLISPQTVGPTLGKISLDESLKAGALGFLAILCYMIIFYRIPGFFASISLIIYVTLLLSLFKLIPVTLTLAGIAGFLLSMGMAVDANILIFSRFREELKSGKDHFAALEAGLRRAWPAIRDGNLTTILVGLILFGLGSSFVKGFAFTLVIGNLIGMFTAIIITNNFLKIFIKTKLENIKWLW